MNKPWRITLFGGLRAQCGGQTITRFRSQKIGGLLAYLAFHLRQAHPREVLIDLFWPQSEPEAGRASLSTALSSLRHQLEPPGTPAHSVLRADRFALSLNPAAVTTDVEAFEQAIRQAARTDNPMERIQCLTRAVDLYQGPLLPGFYEEWIVPAQERLAGLFSDAVSALIRCLEGEGELTQALGYARQAVSVDPLREEGHADLMRLLAALGQPGAALRQYKELERRLEEEWGEEPSAPLRALARQIEKQSGMSAPAPPVLMQGQTTDAPPEVGRRRPRGAAATEPLFAGEVETEHGVRAGAALRQVSVQAPGPLKLEDEEEHLPHLPLQTTRFFGREKEIARLVQMLTPPGRRGEEKERLAGAPCLLVTLTGPGGTGKTRLAIETARRVAEHFAGAVWFVGLADISDAALVPTAILEAMGAQPSLGEPMEQVVTHLNSGGDPALIILDNFEHLVEEGVFTVRRLQERVPSLTLLVTSRQRLNLEGEREFPVPPLPIPEVEPQRHPEEEIQRPGAGVRGALRPDAPERGGRDVPRTSAQRSLLTPEQLMQYPSVQLFVDRAQAARPDFQVTERNAQAVAELCARLEGIPLAIELCAARAQVLTPSQMLRQLSNRFEFLVSRRRDAGERHRTLRAAMEWSYRLLSAEVQRFFRRLSVFRGGWTLEAVEVVCAEPLALDYLAQLRECSLVLVGEREEEMRFRMLETLREFGEAQLSAEEQAYLRQCHTNYFLQLAEQAEPHLSGTESALWLDRLETEHDNLRAALRWSRDHGNAEAYTGLACALGPFWITRGHLNEGRAWLESALRLGSSTSDRTRAQALNAAARLVWHQGDYGLAQSFLEECLTIQQHLGDRAGLARLYNNMGNLAFLQSDYGRARQLLEESLSLFRDLGDREGTAGALNEIGNVLYRQGDYESARPLFQESLEVFQRLGCEEGMARVFNSLGLMAWHQGDDTAARSFQERSLTLFEKLEDKWGIAFTLTNLGNVSAIQGDYERASALHKESLRRFREMGDRRGSAYALNNQAILLYRQGDYVAAWENHAESLKVRRELGDRRGIVFSLEGIAILAAAQQRAECAARLFGAAQAAREAIGLPMAPVDRADYEHALALARAGLGKEAFTQAWSEGRAMTWEQATAYAAGLAGRG